MEIGVKIHYGAEVLDVDVNRTAVTLRGGKRMEADVVVGADGE